MRKLLTVLLLLAAASAVGQPIRWIPFRWEGSTLDGRRFDKLAITVPVTLDNLPHRFKLQLDLGALNTVLYGNTLAPYLAAYPALKAKFDPTHTFTIQSQQNGMLVGVNLKLGNVSFGRRDIGLFKGYGDSLTAATLRDTAEVYAGSIAPDLFQHQVLILDYAHQRLAVADKVPAAYAKAAFQPFQMRNGRLKIPLRIGGVPQQLLFDTGASLFALLTTQQRAAALAPGAVQDSIRTSTWGEHYYVYGRAPKTPIYFGTKQLPPALVYADQLHKFDKLYQEEDVWGITGNAYFLRNVVLIDYQHQRFGVL